MGAVALLLYLAMSPGVYGNKDASELTLVLATTGVAHPTGYPLYTLTGSLFVRLMHALGASWAWAANAFSALGAAVAIALLHATAARLLQRAGVSSRTAALGALLPAAAFGLNPAWIAEATFAEVNSWHLAWTAVAAWVLVDAWFAADRPDDGRTVRRAAIWGFVAGLGLAHHVTSVLTIVPFSIAMVLALRVKQHVSWRHGMIALACAAVPLLSYTYIFWRAFNPAGVQWEVLAPSFASVFRHLTGAEYRAYLGQFSPGGAQARMLATAIVPWLAPSLVVMAVWVWRAGAWPRGLRYALAGAVVANLAYAASYGVADPTSYFLAPLALALITLPAACAAWKPLRRHAWVAFGIALLAVAIPSIASIREGLDQPAAIGRIDRMLRRLWTSIPAERGFVVWNHDMAWRLRAYQILDGEKPGLEVMNPLLFTHRWPRQRFEERHGFDPAPESALRARAASLRPATRADLDRMTSETIAGEINRHSELPVYVFMPEAGMTRLLPKAASDSTRTRP